MKPPTIFSSVIAVTLFCLVWLFGTGALWFAFVFESHGWLALMRQDTSSSHVACIAGVLGCLATMAAGPWFALIRIQPEVTI